jgi:hypothetical protein
MTELITTHEVISAFIDNEPFDQHELAAALATEDGREQLLDLIALRHVVVADLAPESATKTVARPRWRALAAAAALVVALGGGYALGHRIASEAGNLADAPPAPTRVIELTPGVNWQPTKGER